MLLLSSLPNTRPWSRNATGTVDCNSMFVCEILPESVLVLAVVCVIVLVGDMVKETVQRSRQDRRRILANQAELGNILEQLCLAHVLYRSDPRFACLL